MLTKPKLPALGRLMFTSGVSSRMETDNQFASDIANVIRLYVDGDWGDLSADDWEANIIACHNKAGGRLMGAYKTYDKTRVWIITDGYSRQDLGPDYCYTTVLFPEEY